MTDNAKELLAPRKHYFSPSELDGDTCRHCGRNFRNTDFHCTTGEYPESDAQYINRLEAALRLSARQQASVEEVARSLCKADGTAQCAAICLSHFSTSTTGGKCPEAALVWGHKCRALLAEYDIFEKVEG